MRALLTLSHYLMDSLCAAGCVVAEHTLRKAVTTTKLADELSLLPREGHLHCPALRPRHRVRRELGFDRVSSPAPMVPPDAVFALEL